MNLSIMKNDVKSLVHDVLSNYDLIGDDVAKRMKYFGSIRHEEVSLEKDKGINDVVQKILHDKKELFSTKELPFKLNLPNARKTYNSTFDYLTYFAEVQAFNNLMYDLFNKTEKSDRMIFLPHCLRPRKQCQAEDYNDLYEVCNVCGECDIGLDVVSVASAYGYDTNKIAIVGGGEEVPKAISEMKPTGVIGMACVEDLRKFMYFYAKGARDGVVLPPSQMVLLSSTGCKNTSFDKSDVIEVLKK